MDHERLVRLVRLMNTTDRILGESTALAFDDLIKLSSAIKSREHSSEALKSMVMAYERKHGLSEELSEVFLRIIYAAQEIEAAQSKSAQVYSGPHRVYSSDEYETQMQECYDWYNMRIADLCYCVIKAVQTRKINMGSMVDQVLRGDPFNEYGIDLSKARHVSNPYIEAIASTFGLLPDAIMATAETISHVEDFYGWD